MCEPITMAIGTAMGATGAAAAAAGAGVLGSTLASVGSAWAGASERKAKEKSRVAEEKRQSARYEGLGEATRYWENGQANQAKQTATQEIATAPALGKRPDQIGSRYTNTPTAQQPRQPRARFNPEIGPFGGIERTS